MADGNFTYQSRWVLQALGLIAAGLIVGILIVRSNGLLTESQLIRAGVESSAADSFTVPLAAGTAPYSLDSVTWSDHAPVLVAPGKPISVEAGSTVTINGWAFDSAENAPFAAIGGKIDRSEQILSAIVHLVRPDVAAALRNRNARNSGFSLNIDTSDLSLGRHLVVIRALSRARRTAYAFNPDISIDVVDKSAASQKTDAIDAVNGVIVNSAGSDVAPIGIMRSVGKATISGWAFVTEGARLASSVTVLVDGNPAATARYGISRPDVARAYRDVRLTRVGFEGNVPLESLSPGTHEIRLRMTLTDGRAIPSSTILRVNVL